jgi:hypothetical protein
MEQIHSDPGERYVDLSSSTNKYCKDNGLIRVRITTLSGRGDIFYIEDIHLDIISAVIKGLSVNYKQ